MFRLSALFKCILHNINYYIYYTSFHDFEETFWICPWIEIWVMEKNIYSSLYPLLCTERFVKLWFQVYHRGTNRLWVPCVDCQQIFRPVRLFRKDLLFRLRGSISYRIWLWVNTCLIHSFLVVHSLLMVHRYWTDNPSILVVPLSTVLLITVIQ